VAVVVVIVVVSLVVVATVVVVVIVVDVVGGSSSVVIVVILDESLTTTATATAAAGHGRRFHRWLTPYAREMFPYDPVAQRRRLFADGQVMVEIPLALKRMLRSMTRTAPELTGVAAVAIGDIRRGQILRIEQPPVQHTTDTTDDTGRHRRTH
jgi:hypothetical protein